MMMLRVQVIIGAPVVISDDLLRTFNIRLVVRGSVTETRDASSGETERCVCRAARGRSRQKGRQFVAACCGLQARPLPEFRLLLGNYTACRYALPQERGIYRRLPSPSLTTTRSIVQRIVDNRAAFEARNAKKVASEAAYYSASKDYVKEV